MDGRRRRTALYARMIENLVGKVCKFEASLVIISYRGNIRNDKMLVFAENVIEMEIEILILSKKRRK